MVSYQLTHHFCGFVPMQDNPAAVLLRLGEIRSSSAINYGWRYFVSVDVAPVHMYISTLSLPMTLRNCSHSPPSASRGMMPHGVTPRCVAVWGLVVALAGDVYGTKDLMLARLGNIEKCLVWRSKSGRFISFVEPAAKWHPHI
jgi:hypothetical protein